MVVSTSTILKEGNRQRGLVGKAAIKIKLKKFLTRCFRMCILINERVLLSSPSHAFLEERTKRK